MKHPNEETCYFPSTDVDTNAFTLLTKDVEYGEYGVIYPVII
jgi:hypothetical protein